MESTVNNNVCAVDGKDISRKYKVSKTIDEPDVKWEKRVDKQQEHRIANFIVQFSYRNNNDDVSSRMII